MHTITPPTSVSRNSANPTPQWFMSAALVVASISVYGSMAMMSIGAGIVFVAWLWIAKDNPAATFKNTFVKSPLFWPTLALSTACLASLVFAQTTSYEFYGMKPRLTNMSRDLLKLWHIWFPMVLAFLFIHAGAKGQKLALKAWLTGGVLIGILGIIQHFTPLVKPMFIPDPGLEGRYHATGLAGFHLSFASIIIFPTTVALSACITFLRQKRRRWAFAAFVISLVLLLAGWLTYSKINWLAIPVSCLAVVLMRLRGKARIGAVLALIIAGLLATQLPAVQKRFGGVRTINDRLILWDANLAMVKSSPIFGVGWHHNSELSGAYYRNAGVSAYYTGIDIEAFESHAHNNILDQWAGTGTLGLLALLWWMGTVLFVTVRLARSGGSSFARLVGVGLLAAWIGFHVNGLTQTNFWDSKVMHQMSWAVAMALAMKRKDDAL